jgi:hypothetical protein
MVSPMECKLKNKCPNKSDPDVFNCWCADCDGFVHKGCCDLLLAKYDIPTQERPAADELTETGKAIVFCTKGCYSKWWAAKKREAKAAAAAVKAAQQNLKKRKVPWEEDGTLDVLMEWLTTEGNYAEYCGATGNKGKTKTQHHKELSLLIKERKPESDRTEKDVENKITSLERQFRVASDWANNTGQGVENPGDFKAAIAKRCPLYKELEPIMGDHPNAKPLATNEDSSEDESPRPGIAAMAAQTAITHSMDNNNVAGDSDSDNQVTPPKKFTGSVSSIASSKSTRSSNKKKRMKTSDCTRTHKGKGRAVGL